MPEGHTVHRLANRHRRMLVGRRLAVDSPQGRFAEGAALVDGQRLGGTEAWGKHLLHHYPDEGDVWLHVHLGLYGKFRDGTGEPPEPRGALRLRLVADAEPGRSSYADPVWVELRGPTACELMTSPERDALLARLGPDPLRADADVEQVAARVAGSRMPIGTLLMDQRSVAGVGNVYRAEVLFRHGVHPRTPSRDVDPVTWKAMWDDLVVLMRAGVRAGRIVTTEPDDRSRAGRVTRADAHYVYRRQGFPCRRCGARVLADDLAARRVFWCPVCQPEV
ncbi:MAG: DNA glycosylase [Nocardioides sp.]|nr:DNA glycosylase [Nocardioides sp.]